MYVTDIDTGVVQESEDPLNRMAARLDLVTGSVREVGRKRKEPMSIAKLRFNQETLEYICRVYRNLIRANHIGHRGVAARRPLGNPT